MTTYTKVTSIKLASMVALSVESIELMMMIAELPETQYLTVHDGISELRTIEDEIKRGSTTTKMTQCELAVYIGELHDKLAAIIRASNDDTLFLEYQDQVETLMRLKFKIIDNATEAADGIFTVPEYCIIPRQGEMPTGSMVNWMFNTIK